VTLCHRALARGGADYSGHSPERKLQCRRRWDAVNAEGSDLRHPGGQPTEVTNGFLDCAHGLANGLLRPSTFRRWKIGTMMTNNRVTITSAAICSSKTSTL